MICFYGVILLLPLSYQIIILCNLLIKAKITFYLFLIILLIQIVPLLISYLLSIKLYKSILPTSIIMEKYLFKIIELNFVIFRIKNTISRMRIISSRKSYTSWINKKSIFFFITSRIMTVTKTNNIYYMI